MLDVDDVLIGGKMLYWANKANMSNSANTFVYYG